MLDLAARRPIQGFQYPPVPFLDPPPRRLRESERRLILFALAARPPSLPTDCPDLTPCCCRRAGRSAEPGVRPRMGRPGRDAGAPASSARAVARYLVGLRPILAEACAARGEWVGRLGALVEAARPTPRAGRRLAGELGRAFSSASSAGRRLDRSPPARVRALPRGRARLGGRAARLLRAWPTSAGAGGSTGCALAQAGLADGGRGRRFNDEHARLQEALRRRVRSARRRHDRLPTGSGGPEPQANRSVERYFSPVSGASVTIRAPAGASAASLSAQATFAPAEKPASDPLAGRQPPGRLDRLLVGHAQEAVAEARVPERRDQRVAGALQPVAGARRPAGRR